MRGDAFKDMYNQKINESDLPELRMFNDGFLDDDVDEIDEYYEEEEEVFDSPDSLTSVTQDSEEIISVTIKPNLQQEVKKLYTLEDKIREFFEEHMVAVDGVSDEELFLLWNEVFNVALNNNTEMFIEFLKIHCQVSVKNQLALNELFKLINLKGIEFVINLGFYRRTLDVTDIVDIMSCCNESWYNQELLNELSNDSNMNGLIIQAMKKGIKVSDVIQYRQDSYTLICALKLMLNDKFNQNIFNQAVASGTLDIYYNKCFNGEESDRFKVLENREDFDDIYNLILNFENSKRIIRDEIISNFANAYYLRTILIVEAEGRLNVDFAKTYLMKKLGKWEFLVGQYERNEIDLKYSSESIVIAKICTDLAKYNFPVDCFQSDYLQAARCLLLSRYAGKLSEFDYKKFLYLCTLQQYNVLEVLNETNEIINSYNQFWMIRLLHNLNLTTADTVSPTIGDVLVYYTVTNNNSLKRDFYSLDAYVLEPEVMLGIFNKVKQVRVIDDEIGVVMCNQNVISNTHIVCGPETHSSLTRWVTYGIHSSMQQQFADKNPILHTNLIEAMDTAFNIFSAQRATVSTVTDENYYRLNDSVLQFFDLKMSEYSWIDRMFYYVVNKNQKYIGLFRSKRCYKLFILLSKSIRYLNESQVMFQFVSYLVNTFAAHKSKIYPQEFNSLDSTKQIIFIDGLQAQSCAMELRTLVNSIDGIIDSLQKCSSANCYIKNRIMNLKIVY